MERLCLSCCTGIQEALISLLGVRSDSDEREPSTLMHHPLLLLPSLVHDPLFVLSLYFDFVLLLYFTHMGPAYKFYEQSLKVSQQLRIDDVCSSTRLGSKARGGDSLGLAERAPMEPSIKTREAEEEEEEGM